MPGVWFFQLFILCKWGKPMSIYSVHYPFWKIGEKKWLNKCNRSFYLLDGLWPYKLGYYLKQVVSYSSLKKEKISDNYWAYEFYISYLQNKEVNIANNKNVQNISQFGTVNLIVSKSYLKIPKWKVFIHKRKI